jgi:hypothetical protein
MSGEPISQELSKVKRGMMSAVHYFDIFRHPLSVSELRKYMHGVAAETRDFEKALEQLIQSGHLRQHDGYVLPHNRIENITRRKNGEAETKKLWPEAEKKSRLIGNFPFVDAVFLSGSMSKGYMDDDSDIDFLIITRPGRLWIARTLLACYKKIFLMNSHRFFCVNYFLDTNHLPIRDKNLFVATELLFCKPLYNHKLHRQLMEANRWAYEFYPSFPPAEYGHDKSANINSNLKKFIETLFTGPVGNLADKFCMRVTKKFWDIKFRNMNREQYARDMQNTTGVSKHHPNGFRDRIMAEHHERMASFGSGILKQGQSELKPLTSATAI